MLSLDHGLEPHRRPMAAFDWSAVNFLASIASASPWASVSPIAPAA